MSRIVVGGSAALLSFLGLPWVHAQRDAAWDARAPEYEAAPFDNDEGVVFVDPDEAGADSPQADEAVRARRAGLTPRTFRADRPPQRATCFSLQGGRRE